ncbi:CIC11C00000004548 [Sungouiella intermedia]|uniref:CIC11C00000004548 n=1 Tax=Sungouiella intermedia TaxID=45354 RepID=A0A1L0DKE8_9ASCO|nr:CIC11C00000004548 [[Candida] intermedia]
MLNLKSVKISVGESTGLTRPSLCLFCICRLVKKLGLDLRFIPVGISLMRELMVPMGDLSPISLILSSGSSTMVSSSAASFASSMSLLVLDTKGLRLYSTQVSGSK